MTHERIRLGISACLLGEPVRFDGGHKRDPFLVESLGPFVDWVPVCPEVESGLDAPRESMRLVQTDGRIRLLTNKTAQDHTTRMHGYARRRVEGLVDDALVGFVLKKDSPTCGLERVTVYGTAGIPVKSGRGLFADALVARFPLLPVEEDGRLNDPRLRENFVERIFACRRLRASLPRAGRWGLSFGSTQHTNSRAGSSNVGIHDDRVADGRCAVRTGSSHSRDDARPCLGSESERACRLGLERSPERAGSVPGRDDTRPARRRRPPDAVALPVALRGRRLPS
jgi:uncharacterized protein YbbK (DUF523 family)